MLGSAIQIEMLHEQRGSSKYSSSASVSTNGLCPDKRPCVITSITIQMPWVASWSTELNRNRETEPHVMHQKAMTSQNNQRASFAVIEQ